MTKHPSIEVGKTTEDLANAAMTRYAEGDNAAFAELYEVLAPQLFRYLLRQTRNVARCEDLLQQTMLQLHCVRLRFLSEGAVTPWAFAIARRALIDSRGFRRETLGSACLPMEEPVTGNATDEMLHDKQVVHVIERELARLPLAQGRAVELMKRDDLSLREDAQVLARPRTPSSSERTGPAPRCVWPSVSSWAT